MMINQIMILLTKDFALLVVIAFAIAAPLGYYFCEEWLTNFATRINIPIWMIAASGAISLVIAMVTISFQSFNTARENPVRAMKAD